MPAVAEAKLRGFALARSDFLRAAVRRDAEEAEIEVQMIVALARAVAEGFHAHLLADAGRRSWAKRSIAFSPSSEVSPMR